MPSARATNARRRNDALDQEADAKPASRAEHGEDIEAWERKVADGSVAVGVFNVDSFDGDRVLSRDELGLSGRYMVRDLWQRKDLGMMPNHLILHITGHGAALLRLRKCR